MKIIRNILKMTRELIIQIGDNSCMPTSHYMHEEMDKEYRCLIDYCMRCGVYVDEHGVERKPKILILS